MEENMRNRLTAMQNRLKDINHSLETEDFSNNVKALTDLSKEASGLREPVELFEEYCKLEKETADALELMAIESDEDMIELLKEERKTALARLDKIESELEPLLLPTDPNDSKNIIVEIRGAVGGDEANIFAGDLCRMYVRYAEEQGWQTKFLSAEEGSSGGYSFVSFLVKGENVYSKLKFESGGHRVQRVPKTESSGRIHTSIATVLVMPEAEEVDIQIAPSELKMDTFRSQGAGGQNVNKTESAVRITHIPTGIVVSCQTEKAQLQNREICMRMIRAKVKAFYQEKEDAARASERKLKVGTGERSEKIRTYNYPQNRVTDHRIGFTTNKLDRVMEGDLEEIIEGLIHFDQEQRLLEEENK